ncbi:PIN domain-containing protein [bacterium]|nr:PIN domain-containing protein [bacterium]
MTWLLDVNVLIAALVAAHEHHDRVASWLAALPADDRLATCSITELGFVRVLHQAPHLRVPVRESVRLLTRFRTNRRRVVIQLPDEHGASNLPKWVKTARQITDGHLAGLAVRHGAHLATLDNGIPGATVIPG